MTALALSTVVAGPSAVAQSSIGSLYAGHPRTETRPPETYQRFRNSGESWQGRRYWQGYQEWDGPSRVEGDWPAAREAPPERSGGLLVERGGDWPILPAAPTGGPWKDCTCAGRP
jgi:hypothetical protein